MNEYHKIDSLFKRDPDTHEFLPEYSRPEFGYLESNEWTFTEKVDGTNIRISWDGGSVVSFGGRTDAAGIPPRLFMYLQYVFTPERFVRAGLVDCALYGEGYGAGIQKGGGDYGLDQRFILFDVRIGSFWLRREDVDDVACKLGIPSVPTVGQGALGEAVALIKGGFASFLRCTPPEGIVLRPTIELSDRAGRRIISKLKLRDYQGGRR